MLGKNLKKIREAKKISQRKLARMVSISGQMISKIENGDANPSLATLKKMAAALDVPISALFPQEDIDALNKTFSDLKKTIERLHPILDRDIANLLDPDNEEKVYYNFHLLSKKERQQALDMLEVLFPHYGGLPIKEEKNGKKNLIKELSE